MKFDITVLTILGFSIKWTKGYVADVNPKLVRTESTTIRPNPNVDFKMNHQNLIESSTTHHLESSSHQNLISTTSSYDNSRIVFPSPVEVSFKRIYSAETQEQLRDETAIRSFQTNPVSSNNKPRESEQLSRLSSGYPFERDDDDVRPIWSN